MRKIVLIILLCKLTPTKYEPLKSRKPPKLLNDEETTVVLLINTAMDVIQHSQIEIWKLYLQRQSLRGNAQYEIGFLIRTTEERYRRMVDLYNTSITMDTKLRTREHVLHLQAIEKLHWDLMHLANMLHEVERKYKIKRVSICVSLDADVEKIMSELSWGTKTRFLEYIYLKQNKSNSNSTRRQYGEGIRKARTLLKKSLPRRHWQSFLGDTDYEEDVIDQSHNGQAPIRRARSLDSSFLISNEFNKSLFHTNKDDEDDVMKMKLFRLMYESVKDSDLKIKRAELVKADYENSTGFDLGYVAGDASDKVNVMMDISRSLKRMYHVWKPVEHVNAYEQIANLAIEVSHLVDMARMIEPSSAHGPPTNY